MTAAAMMAMSTGAAYAAGGSGATHLEGTVGGEAYSLLVDLSTLNLLKVKLGPVPYVSLPLEGGIVSETLLTVDLLNILNSGTLVNMTSGGVGGSESRLGQFQRSGKPQHSWRVNQSGCNIDYLHQLYRWDERGQPSQQFIG